MVSAPQYPVISAGSNQRLDAGNKAQYLQDSCRPLPGHSSSRHSNKFLELRYGKPTRYLVSAMFILQMILWMASVLYSPVLALNAVTDISMELSIILFGSICAFYCTVVSRN
ncbi:UNVERIFIED_CONTAM: sodium-dependent multivitamin transporter [Trichonephila clavipes]